MAYNTSHAGKKWLLRIRTSLMLFIILHVIIYSRGFILEGALFAGCMEAIKWVFGYLLADQHTQAQRNGGAAFLQLPRGATGATLRRRPPPGRPGS